MEPVLLLTTVPYGTDGYLRLSEVMGLRMNAGIVALTACMSGLGKTISGEGVMGMGRAFQYAGAKSVLMSLWSVHEDASVKLVERFFRHINERKSELEAIKLARDEIRKEGYDHPYFWAPFILVGEVGAERPFSIPPSLKSSPVAAAKAEKQEASIKPSFMSPAQDARDPAKDRDLIQAAQKGDDSAVKRLLAEGADVACTDEEYAATPLHWAAFKGHSKVVSCCWKRAQMLTRPTKQGPRHYSWLPVLIIAALWKFCSDTRQIKTLRIRTGAQLSTGLRAKTTGK